LDAADGISTRSGLIADIYYSYLYLYSLGGANIGKNKFI